MEYITTIIIAIIIAVSVLCYRYLTLKFIRELDIKKRFGTINFIATNIIREIDESELDNSPLVRDSIKGDLREILKNTINLKD